MRRQCKILALASLSFVTFAAVAASTVAWFSYAGNISFGTDADAASVTGGSVASYYESGTGASNDPYIISNRNHLYNLAWLQYIGYYNDSEINHANLEDEDPNNDGIQQKYFKIKNDIDLQGLTLPPIGTDKYPFLGHFDGNNKTISNFTISNDDPTEDGSDFGVAKPSILYDGEEPKIVGFFGVVGQLPDQTITYSSSIVSISNITLENFTVKSETNQTLIGLAGGYVNGTMSGVKVDGEAIIDLGNTAKAAVDADITSELSDYGLVGYCEDTDVVGAFSQHLSSFYDSSQDSSGGTGVNPGEGGSISIRDYNEWFFRLHYDAGFDGGTYLVKETDRTKTATSTDDQGHTYEEYVLKVRTGYDSPVINRANLPENVYMKFTYNANQYFIIYRETNNSKTGIFYCNGTTYNMTWEVNSSGYTYNVDGTQSYHFTFTDATKPTLGGSTVNDVYLSHTSASSSWYRLYNRATVNQSYAIRITAGDLRASGTNRTYYLTYNDNRVVKHYEDYTDEDKINNYRLRDSTYIPLKFTDATKVAVDPKNTGYIVGSNVGEANGSPKISSEKTFSSITKSLNGSSYVESKFEALTYAKYNGTWGWYGIGDKHNNNTKNSSLNDYTIVSAQTLGLKKYEYYNGLDNATDQDVLARDAIHNVLSSSTHLSGLQFDGVVIDQNLNSSNFTTIPRAKIGAWDDKSTTNVNEGIVNNVPVPKGSIDFNFSTTGFINFFAGAYNYTGTGSGSSGTLIDSNFFSIYSVNRNSSTKQLTEINEILAVYDNSKSQSYAIGTEQSPAAYDSSKLPNGKTNPKYAYLLSDKNGNTSYFPAAFSSVTDKSNRLLFDVDAALRLRDQGDEELERIAPENEAMYYFEIPVNDGEYAMGMVSNATSNYNAVRGAYLMYLDIGANADTYESDDVQVYSITSVKTGNYFPCGVDFDVSGAGNNGGDSVGFSIVASSSGTISFTTSSDGKSLTVVDSGSISSYSFKGHKFTSSADPPTGFFKIVTSSTIGGLPTSQTTKERTLYIHAITPNDDEYDIKIVDTLNSSTGAIVGESKFYIDIGSGFEQTTLSTVQSYVPSLDTTRLTVLRALEIVVELNGENDIIFETVYDLENSSYENKIIDCDITLNGASITINILNSDYTFNIGGVTYSDDSSYHQS